jgi:uncharacterized membrane protein YdjX (TVP38/TMEM64 family)
MSPSAPPVSWPRRIARIVILLLGLTVGFFVLREVKSAGLLDQALRWIQGLGPWAPVVFIILYIATVLIFLPAAILTAGGGFIFGMVSGAIYVLVAATIAANICFLLGRHIARDWIAHRLEAQPRFKALDEAVARDGWKIVALVRLAPIFPFSITSYGFGLTRVPLRQYFLANFAMIPGTLMYVYFGSIARDLTERPTTPPWVKWTIFALTLVVVFYITRFAKRVLSQKIS